MSITQQAALLGHSAVTDTVALEQAMTSAGIPWTSVVEGGQPVAYRIERLLKSWR